MKTIITLPDGQELSIGESQPKTPVNLTSIKVLTVDENGKFVETPTEYDKELLDYVEDLIKKNGFKQDEQK